MLHSITARDSKTFSQIAAVVLFVAATLRVPLFQDARVLFTVCFEAAVIAALCAVVWRYVDRWTAVFLGMAFFSHLFPFYGLKSFLANHNIVYGVLWVSFIVVFVSDFTSIYRMMTAIAAFHLIALLSQTAGYDLLFYSKYANAVHRIGLMSNPNEVSTVFALCAPAFFRKKYILALPIVLLGMFLAQGSGGPVAFMVGLSLWAVSLGYGMWVGGLIACGAPLVYLWDDTLNSILARFKILQYGWIEFKKHWILGSGLGHWKIVAMRHPVGPEFFLHAHNEYAQIIFEMGAIVLVPIFGFFGTVIKNFKRLSPITVFGMGAVSVNLVYSFTLHIGTTAMLAVTWIAMAINEMNKTTEVTI